MNNTLKYLQQLDDAAAHPQLSLVRVLTHHNIGYMLSGLYVEGPGDKHYSVKKLVNLKDSDTVVMEFMNAGRKLVFSCRDIKDALIKAGGSAASITVNCGDFHSDYESPVTITVRHATWEDVKLGELLKD